VGAGPLPRVEPTDHPPRPPIPIVPVDAEAMAAARERGAGELAVWLAGVTGAQRPVVRSRTVWAESVIERRADRATGAEAASSEPALTVPEVAQAVDAGRDLAARAAAQAITLVVARSQGPAEGTQTVVARSQDPADGARGAALIAALADDPAHPLRSLRRLGNAEIAVLCGVALGAGERGLGCVCEGLAALAGAAVAAAIEPTLRPRLRAADGHEQAAQVGIAAVDVQELAAVLD